MGDDKSYKMEENRSFLVVLAFIAGLAFLFHLIGFFGPGWLVYELSYNPNFQFFTGHGSYGGVYGGGYSNTGQYGQGTYAGGYNPNYGTGGGYQYGGGYGGGTYGGGYGTGYNPAYGGSWSGLGAVVVTMRAGLWAFHSCIEYGPDREDCKITFRKLKTSVGDNSNTAYNTRSGMDALFDEMTRQKVLSTISIILAFVGLLFNVLLFTTIIESRKVKRIVCALCWSVSAVLLFAAIGVQAKEIAEMNDDFKDYARVYPDKYKFENYFPWSLLLLGFSAFFGLLNAVLVLFLLPRCVQHSDRGSYHGTPMNEKI